MVRKKNNIHSFNIVAIIAILIMSLSIMPHFQASATTVNVTADEMLTVKVTMPSVAPSGTPSTSDGVFILNTVGLDVATNNTVGFTASMTTETTTTALTNESDNTATIPILTQNYTKSNFPVNYWGFSTNDTNYVPIAASNASAPTYITSAAAPDSNVHTNLYFGAKANAEKAAGVYSNTVIISVVSGINTDQMDNPGGEPTNPVTPTDPVTPSSDPNNTNTTPTYISTSGTAGSSNGATVYTRTTGSTTGTTVTAGNTTGSTYVSPAGVTTTAMVGEGTPLATGLAITAGVAATTGIIFFIVAKRRRDDEDEEDYE